MRRFLQSFLVPHRSIWRSIADQPVSKPPAQETAGRTALIGSDGPGHPASNPQSHAATSAASGRNSLLPTSRKTLRMRSEPGDIRHAVISGRLGEVCDLLEKLAADHEFAASAGTALH